MALYWKSPLTCWSFLLFLLFMTPRFPLLGVIQQRVYELQHTEGRAGSRISHMRNLTLSVYSPERIAGAGGLPLPASVTTHPSIPSDLFFFLMEMCFICQLRSQLDNSYGFMARISQGG